MPSIEPVTPYMAKPVSDAPEPAAEADVALSQKPPKAVVARLNAEFNRILNSSEIRKHFTSQDVDVVGGTPEAFGEFLKKEVALWGKVVREAKIKAE